MSTDANMRLSSARETTGPMADRLMAPLCLAVLLTSATFLASTQLRYNGGDFSANVYAPFANRVELERAWPKEKTPEDLFRAGSRIYERNCQICHQADGTGIPGQVPPLAGSEWVLADSPNPIARVVLNGLQGPVQIRNRPFGSVQMPPWKDTLDDEQIAAVLTFIRGNRQWGNNASSVTEAEVRAIREKLSHGSVPFSADELLKMSDDE